LATVVAALALAPDLPAVPWTSLGRPPVSPAQAPTVRHGGKPPGPLLTAIPCPRCTRPPRSPPVRQQHPTAHRSPPPKAPTAASLLQPTPAALSPQIPSPRAPSSVYKKATSLP
jgi:hypothetical protein